MDGIYLQDKNMNCNNIDDYGGKMTVSLEDDDTERQDEVLEKGPERQIEVLEEGHILRRSKRLAGILADGPSVTDGIRKVTGDTTVRTIHLDESVKVLSTQVNRKQSTLVLMRDPGDPKTIFEALNGDDKKWWKLSGIAKGT